MGPRPIVARFISKPCRQNGHVLTRWQCYSNMQLTQRATHTPTTGNGSSRSRRWARRPQFCVSSLRSAIQSSTLLEVNMNARWLMITAFGLLLAACSRQAPAPKTDLDRFQGTWNLVSAMQDADLPRGQGEADDDRL